MDKEGSLHKVADLSKKVRARGTTGGNNNFQPPSSAFVTSTPIDMRKRTRCRRRLTIEDKITIVRQALLLKILHKDIAKEHQVTPSAVSGLVGKALKNPKFLQELLADRDRKEQNRQKIADLVVEMNMRDEFIDSAARVQKEFEKRGGPETKTHVVQSVLRKDLGMRFKKVSPIALTANSHRNLIL